MSPIMSSSGLFRRVIMESNYPGVPLGEVGEGRGVFIGKRNLRNFAVKSDIASTFTQRPLRLPNKSQLDHL